LRLSGWQLTGIVALALLLAAVGLISWFFSEWSRETAWGMAPGASIGHTAAARQALGYRPEGGGPVSCFSGQIRDSIRRQLTLPACVSDGNVLDDDCDPVDGDTVAPNEGTSFPDRVLTTLVVPSASAAKVANFLLHYSVADNAGNALGYEKYLLGPKSISTRECDRYSLLFIEQHYADLPGYLPGR
jgi:hypothetical protein